MIPGASLIAAAVRCLPRPRPRRHVAAAVAPRPRIARRVVHIALGCGAGVLPVAVPLALMAPPPAPPPAAPAPVVAPAPLPWGIGAEALLPPLALLPTAEVRMVAPPASAPAQRVPEPASLVLLASGALLLWAIRSVR